MVRGKPRFGFLVDTGASAALMGTDVFKHMLDSFLSPHGKEVSYIQSMNTFTGIDGESQPRLSAAEMPLGLGWPGLDNVTLSVDQEEKDPSVQASYRCTC